MMRITRRMRMSVLAGAVPVLALTGCGGGAADLPPESDRSWSAVQQRAEAEGTVRFYSTGQPPANESLVKAFNEKYPNITVDVVRGTAELAPRVDAEIKGNVDGADVFLSGDQQWYLDNEEHLMPLDIPSAEDWPSGSWEVENFAPHVAYIPLSIIVWNTDMFPDGFSDWNDLLAPDVRGKIGIRDTVDIVVASYLEFQEEVNGPDYLPALAKQNPRFYHSVVPMTQSVAAGEIGVANMAGPPVIRQLEAEGAPIDYVMPENGWVDVVPVSVLKTSQRPNAARVFVDFLMSPEGQAAFNGNEYAASPLPEVEGTINIDLANMTVKDPTVTTPAVVERWRERYRQIFGQE